MSRNRAVFLDRDGTIIKDVGHPLKDLDEVELLPDVANRIQAIWDAGWLPVVVSNQAGVWRGEISKDEVDKVNAKMVDLLEAAGVHSGVPFASIMFCPHRPEDECFCRKPMPGLLYIGAFKFGMDLRECLMIGNDTSDVGAAKAVNCPFFKVTNGLGDWDPGQLSKL